jgi:hypothetical protein
MFRFVNKKEVWGIEDSGILENLPQLPYWSLKNIQDAVAYNYLRSYENGTIAEIGGGNSRLLQVLAKNNRCFNIDKFEGVGGGPKHSDLPAEISIVHAYLGKETKNIIENEVFDVVFSISVIEHIADCDLKDLFEESARISKKGALSLHLIDVYCAEEPRQQARMTLLVNLFFSYFSPLEQKMISPNEVEFSCSYATNPDNAMNRWNKSVPGLRQLRETHQSCSLILGGIRK